MKSLVKVSIGKKVLYTFESLLSMYKYFFEMNLHVFKQYYTCFCLKFLIFCSFIKLTLCTTSTTSLVGRCLIKIIVFNSCKQHQIFFLIKMHEK